MNKTKTSWTVWIAAAVVLAGWMSSPSAFAGWHSRCGVCEYTAYLALRADLGEARSDYYIATGKGINFGDRMDRKEAAVEAREELVENTSEARAVYEARRELCELLSECRYDPEVDPDDFLSPEDTALSPNPYFPLVPGTVYTYEGETDEGTETIVVTITANTVEIMGVTCIEVRDTVTLEGEFVEDTLDWYAQDQEGNVWYFGEISFNYEDGEVVDLEGSWKAGENGAKPGIVMKSSPEVGEAYRQEWLLGEAEDAAQVLAVDETISAGGSTYTHCVKTLDINPHEPELVEHKYFAPGIGFVFEIKPEDGETVELISVTGP